MELDRRLDLFFWSACSTDEMPAGE